MGVVDTGAATLVSPSLPETRDPASVPAPALGPRVKARGSLGEEGCLSLRAFQLG